MIPIEVAAKEWNDSLPDQYKGGISIFDHMTEKTSIALCSGLGEFSKIDQKNDFKNQYCKWFLEANKRGHHIQQWVSVTTFVVIVLMIIVFSGLVCYASIVNVPNGSKNQSSISFEYHSFKICIPESVAWIAALVFVCYLFNLYLNVVYPIN